jgi:hypothetical protein
VRGTLPDVPRLYQLDDGSEDIGRFVRDYGCTPDEAMDRGASCIAYMRNWNVPGNVQPRDGYVRPVDPNYVPPPTVTPQPLPAGEDIPADEPVSISDPLVEALVRQARDKAAASDAARSKSTGK